MTATVTGSGYGTDSYTFEVIPFHTETYTGGTAINFGPGNTDDTFKGPFPIGFEFCFFNQYYTQFWVGTNGWISFRGPGPGENWTTFTPTTIPNPASTVPKACIMAPWQDWYPQYGGALPCVFYKTLGIPGDQMLVVDFIDCPMYSCYTTKGTFQIVIHEQNSIIENNLTVKPYCVFQQNRATQGVHNSNGTAAYTAIVNSINRNNANWTATNESMRFVPSGITWHSGSVTGPIVGYGTTLTVTPSATTEYFAVINTCENGNASASTVVTVYPLPTPIITGGTNPCMGSIFTYQTDPTQQSYTWSVSAGGTIISGPGTTSIQVQWTASGAQTVGLLCTSLEGCAQLVPTVKNVTVNPTPIPTISGPALICANPPVEVQYSTENGYLSYLWEVSSGGTIIGASVGNSITVRWNNTGSHTVSVNYTTPEGCTAQNPTLISVSVNPLPNPGITGTPEVCKPITEIYSTPLISGHSYNWTVTGGTILSGQTSNQVTVSFTIAGNAMLNLTETINSTGCFSPAAPFPVIVKAYPGNAGVISGNAIVCQGDQQPYSINPIPDATSYIWGITPPSAGIINGTNTATMQWNPAFSGGATLSVKGHNDCGDGTGSNLPVMVNPAPIVGLAECNDMITITTARSFRLKGGNPMGGVYSGPGVTITAGQYYFNPSSAMGTGLKTITYSYANTYSCIASATVNILVKPDPIFTCGGNFKDVRDDQLYPTFLLPNNQCWMAKNLNYGNLLISSQAQKNNCVNEKFCPGNDASNCNTFGAFYQWDELMAYDPAPGNQGLCPPGWHVPVASEWDDLITFNQGNSQGGAFLKDLFMINGFHAILGGVFFMNTSWAFLPSAFSASFYWTSSPTSPPDPYRMVARSLNSGTPSVPYYKSSRANAFPVRCVKD